MAARTIDQLCAPSKEVTSQSLVDQVASLDQLANGKIDGDAFFSRNHFTDGLRRLVETGFERLSGKSDTGAYYLTQAMGGGKTHSLIAFGLLAKDPSLRRRILPDLSERAPFGAAKVVMFNGHQNPRNLLWGFVADSLGRSETMTRFWSNGPQSPGVDDWIAAIGKDEPVLILLDELPSYLQMAQAQPAGNTTVGDITIGALERLFNALPQLPLVCVVVTNLKDDVYLDGSNQLRTLIESLTKHYDRNATAITPVQQNTGEVFEIIRKRLFDKLPDAGAVEEVGQAYVEALDQAKRVDTIPTTPEVFLQRIRETYPFHPSIRDIVARFSENRGYQKTRALIRLLRHAIRGAMASKEQVFLVGLHHLDLNDQATQEEIRKINASFNNAISKDIADRGNALAEKIDSVDGAPHAAAVAKTLLMSSLSTAENPTRGLREGELYEALVDPLVKVSDLKGALEKFQTQAWYLQKDIQERIYVSQTANVTAEINEIAESIAEEVVDETLRTKLKDIFRPRVGDVYDAEMAVLPALDEIVVSDDRVRLVILEHPADALPPAFNTWWSDQERQNGVLLLTVDPNATKSMRALARRTRAIARVAETIRNREGAASPQMREVDALRDKDENSFRSALREAFKTIIYPIEGKLRAYGDLRMEFDRNDYSGEEQIRKVLTERGKFIPSDKFDSEFENLRADAEERLFDADAVPVASLRRNAALRPGWFWLPRNGLDTLIKAATQKGYWRERDGLIHRRFESVTSVSARIDDYAPDPITTGNFTLTVTKQDADVVYYSEQGPPDPKSSARLDGVSYQTQGAVVWFLAVDTSEKARTGDVFEWRARPRLRAEVTSTADGKMLSVLVAPRDAAIHISFDGSDPRSCPTVIGSVAAPTEATRARIVAVLGNTVSEEEVVTLGSKVSDLQAPFRAKTPLDENAPVKLTSAYESRGPAHAFSTIAALREFDGVQVEGGRLHFGGKADHEAFLTLRFGASVPITGIGLDELAKVLLTTSCFPEPDVELRIDAIAFGSGRDLKRFADKVGLDFERQLWTQGS